VIDIDELYDDSTEQLLRHVDYLIAAEEFVKKVMGEAASEATLRALSGRYGCPVVGITLGNRGSIFFESGRTLRTPAVKVQVADTTGAGDVFHGAFIYGLLQRWPLERIARFSNAAAALKCANVGARAGIPELKNALGLAMT